MTTTNTTKAAKVTLNSIVFAAAPVLRELKEGESYTKTEMKQFEKELAEHVRTTSLDLARYIVNKTENTDLISKLLAATVEAIPSVVDEVLKAKQEEEARKAEEKRKAEEERQAQLQAAAEELEKKKQDMLKVLTDNGVDLEVAKAMVAAGAKNLAPAHAVKNSYERVSCTIEGNQYDVPVRGNMSQALKDLAAKYGFADDREGFIEKFRDEPATANAEENTAEA
ncbi:hypothetical protein GAP32_005 [Cronobacter phage vB_CsaM_GAP32]|uniref:Uncharacterized protein n=1 Tax=Cronobacter phage vB_CsaM_GAP32 TaxID=1141136 RepID=K4F735_9CAUD|nr:hypothetical protein GAP32_005 [Cronobacter phage vB_CsaM_GAP32]AFC21452.1 hypothetical protein GAP32_005 [Cronobacter phage vB_CsaM_GAP32]